MSMGQWVSCRAGTWLIDYYQITFSMSSIVNKSGPNAFVIIFYVICLTGNNLSGIQYTTDTSFMQPCSLPIQIWGIGIGKCIIQNNQCGRSLDS